MILKNNSPLKENAIQVANPMEQVPTFKLIMIGDSAVGKTQILMNFLDKKFSYDYQSTIGVEFHSQVIKIDRQSIVKLQIWDTAGQENFRSIISSFYRNVHAVIIIYNIASEDSFLSCERWLKESLEHSQDIPIKILVGTQCDREEERQISLEKGEELKIQLGFDLFFETSALKSINVKELFQQTAQKVYIKYMQNAFTNIGVSSPIKLLSSTDSKDSDNQLYQSNGNQNGIQQYKYNFQADQQRKSESTCC